MPPDEITDFWPLEKSAARGADIHDVLFLLTAAQSGTVNCLYKSTKLLFVVRMSEINAAVNIAQGHLKYVLYMYYHA